MRLENINNEKFQKLEAFQVENLEKIQGGIVAASYTSMSSAASVSVSGTGSVLTAECIKLTIPWNDSNSSKESTTAIDTVTGYLRDVTNKDCDNGLPPEFV